MAALSKRDCRGFLEGIESLTELQIVKGELAY